MFNSMTLAAVTDLGVTADTRVRVTTASGSVYTFYLADGELFVQGNNLPNPDSLPMGKDGWPVTLLRSPQQRNGTLYFECKHPERYLPGGGKQTTRVVQIEVVR